MNASFTLIRAINPPMLSKSFWLDAKGALNSTPMATLRLGVAYEKSVADVAELATRLTNAKGQNWALVAGVSGYGQAVVVTKGAVEKCHNDNLPIIARTKRYFHCPAGAGLLLFDYDAPKGETPLAPAELHAHLVEASPWLRGVAMAILASTSSYIRDAALGFFHRGAGGLHAYAIINDARATPRAINAAYQATFAMFGYVIISKGGARLPRSIIDVSVASPERLIFEAGARLTPDLTQECPAPFLVPGGWLDAATVPEAVNDREWRAAAVSPARRASTAHTVRPETAGTAAADKCMPNIRTAASGTLTPDQLGLLLTALNPEEYGQGNYNEWIKLCAACHDATGGAGLDEFASWCCGDADYNTFADWHAVARHWLSFEAGRAGGVSYKTLLRLVREARRTDLLIRICDQEDFAACNGEEGA